jgi:beta-lactamase superfamily II metal-dependent hydrolase
MVPGDTVVVNADIFAATSQEAYDQMLSAADMDDKMQGDTLLWDLVSTGRVFRIDTGERATVLDQGASWYKVRFTSGKNTGKTGWVIMRSVRKP